MLVELCKAKGAAMTAANVGLRRFDAHQRHANVKPFRAGEVYEIEEAGTGMVCISIAEIDRIAQEFDGPWFHRTYEDKRNSKPDVGLDIYFSRLLRAFDGTIWADTTIETVHAYTDHHSLYYGGQLEAVVEPLT
jgi:hypothetical protein